jgi:hypothetical protein
VEIIYRKSLSGTANSTLAGDRTDGNDCFAVSDLLMSEVRYGVNTVVSAVANRRAITIDTKVIDQLRLAIPARLRRNPELMFR